MPSVYLEPDDYAAYGVPNATAQQVSFASTTINGYLRRREGLLWSPDANGEACYMNAMTPQVVLVNADPISPGQNVNVTVTGVVNAANIIQIGFVLILERTNSAATEACIVTSITGNVVQLANVQFAHDAGINMEYGLTLYESKVMPPGRPITTLAQWPLQKIMAAQGRYGYPRRGDTATSSVNTFNMLAVFTQFGGPPLWEGIDQTRVGFNPDTAQVWAPAGIMLAYFTDIRFSYIAGYTYSSLPADVKQACANIINAAAEFPVNGAVKNQRAGDTAIERFAASNFDDDTKTLLNPYKARLYV